MLMNARLTDLGETPLVEAWGDIDHNSCGALDTALADALERGSPIALVDLRNVSYIDSGGLSVIFSQARRLREGGWLGLIGPNSNVRRLLELVGLFADPRFRVFDDRETAEAHLREGTAP
jgi:anti-anti-sigma factor